MFNQQQNKQEINLLRDKLKQIKNRLNVFQNRPK